MCTLSGPVYLDLTVLFGLFLNHEKLLKHNQKMIIFDQKINSDLFRWFLDHPLTPPLAFQGVSCPLSTYPLLLSEYVTPRRWLAGDKVATANEARGSVWAANERPTFDPVLGTPGRRDPPALFAPDTHCQFGLKIRE